MTQKTSEKKVKGSAKENVESKKQWKKPRITRHGNMRQLTQMSA